MLAEQLLTGDQNLRSALMTEQYKAALKVADILANLEHEGKIIVYEGI